MILGCGCASLSPQLDGSVTVIASHEKAFVIFLIQYLDRLQIIREL